MFVLVTMGVCVVMMGVLDLLHSRLAAERLGDALAELVRGRVIERRHLAADAEQHLACPLVNLDVDDVCHGSLSLDRARRALVVARALRRVRVGMGEGCGRAQRRDDESENRCSHLLCLSLLLARCVVVRERGASLARLADALAATDPRIFLVEGMPLSAHCLREILGIDCLSAQLVLATRHGFEMIEVDAVAILATACSHVVDLEAVWNRSDELLVRHAMHSATLAVECHLRIAVLVESALPEPASSALVDDDAPKKPFPDAAIHHGFIA